MLRARLAVATSLIGAGGVVYYVHASQVWQRERMHAAVLRDIAAEEAEKAAAAPPAGTSSAADVCELGVCDLKRTRFRDAASAR